MGTKVRAALGAVLVAMVIAAGCSDGDGEERDSAAEDTEANESSDSSESTEQGADDGATETTDGGDTEAPEGSDPELRQEYIDAIVASNESEESGLEDADAECLATAFVDAAGADALSAVVTPEELASADQSPADLGVEFPENAGEVFYDQLSSCTDVRDLVLGAQANTDEALRACLDEAIDDELLEDFTVALFFGSTEEGDAEFQAIQDRVNEATEPCAAGE